MEAAVLEAGSDIWTHLFLPKFLPFTGRIKGNTACATDCFSILPRALKSLLSDLRLFVATSLVPTIASYFSWDLFYLKEKTVLTKHFVLKTTPNTYLIILFKYMQSCLSVECDDSSSVVLIA